MTGAAAAAICGPASGVSYLAETTAWEAACTTPPSTTRKNLIDGFIRNLKADGLWSGLDWLLILAAEDEQAARVNLVAPSKVATRVNSCTFTTDRGFTGDDISMHISLGEALDAGGNWTLNSAALGVWATQVGSSAAKYQVGVSSGRMNIVARNNGGNETFQINDGTASVLQGNTGSRSGHRALSREGASLKRAYFNGVLTADLTTASTSLAANTAYLLRFSSNYGVDQINAFWSGAALDTTGVATMHTRLNTILTAIGAV